MNTRDGAMTRLLLLAIAVPVAFLAALAVPFALPRATSVQAVVVAPLKGLAMADWGHPEDYAALDAHWKYAWSDSNCSAPCVNMSKYGALSVGCYPFLLFLNEPDNLPPSGSNVTPAQAVPLAVAQQAHCPDTVLVMGNSYGTAWLTQFLAAFRAATGHAFIGLLGLHEYCWQTASACVASMASLPALFPGYRFWITEFNCVGCSVADFVRQVNAIGLSPVVDRFAVYTNRQPCTNDCGWVISGIDLVNADGTLTAQGQAYAGWHVSQLFMPQMSKLPQGYP